MKKKCSVCQKTKSLKSFWSQTKSPDGKQSRCISCAKIGWKKYTGTRHWEWLEYAYNITQIEYEKLLTLQNNKCAICNKSQTRRLCVDHCHKTGKVRGLLCPSCNAGLGQYKDNIELLQSAIKYLERQNE